MGDRDGTHVFMFAQWLSLVSVAVIKTMTKINLGKKAFMLVFRLQSIMKGSRNGNSRHEGGN